METMKTDADGVLFDLHIASIREEIEALKGIYMGPIPRGILFDLEETLGDLVASRNAR